MRKYMYNMASKIGRIPHFEFTRLNGGFATSAFLPQACSTKWILEAATAFGSASP
jgi:hypothetical protein